jgi:hypothetical protein
VIARLLIWNLFDSKTTLDELPELGGVQGLIGNEPAVAEEFDVVE